MTSIRLKYVNTFIDRHGQPRAYFRYRGQSWPMPLPEGSPAFITAYHDYLARIAQPQTQKPEETVHFLKNSVAWVIERYLSHTEYTSKKPGTQKVYRTQCDAIRRRIGAAPIADLTPKNVRALRDRIAEEQSTSTADMCIMVLRILWDFAAEFCQIDLGSNPAREVKKVHIGSEYQPWPDAVIENFKKASKPNLRLALSVLLYTGQRVGDAAGMKWSDFDGRSITVIQEKTNAPLLIPIHPKLLRLLNAAPRDCEHILVSVWGRRYSDGDSLSESIRRQLAEINAIGFTAHGLRKNAAVNLIEAGCTIDEAKAITGHRSSRMLEHYAKKSRQKVLAERAIQKLANSG